MGDNDGGLDVQWDAGKSAKSFAIQTSRDPLTANNWVSQPSATRSSMSLPGASIPVVN
jgi:hypothetical protein